MRVRPPLSYLRITITNAGCGSPMCLHQGYLREHKSTLVVDLRCHWFSLDHLGMADVQAVPSFIG